jgi:hypothetical protein
MVVFDVQIGARPGQGSNNFKLAVLSRPTESSSTGIVPRVHIGSGLNQRENGTDIVSCHRIFQRCHSTRISSVFIWSRLARAGSSPCQKEAGKNQDDEHEDRASFHVRT